MEEELYRNSCMYSRHLIGRVRDLVLWARQNEWAPYQVSSRQAYVMLIMQSLGHKTTLAELANYTHREISTISIQLKRMEKDGLVKKLRESPKSLRLTFELTEKGIDIYNKSKEMKSDKMIFSALSEEERQQLILMLKKIINKAEKYQFMQTRSRVEKKLL